MLYFQSERKRIEASGGWVMTLGGCVRVNGRLAVSRAIGDYGLKDVVIGDPDIVCIPFNGKEDFLIMASDGLWDFVEEDELAIVVYEMLEKTEGELLINIVMIKDLIGIIHQPHQLIKPIQNRRQHYVT